MSRPVPCYAFLMAVLLVINSLCFADGGPALLKSELKKPDKIWVGQQLDLNVTLFTTSAFTGVPRFDVPKVPGMVIIADDTHPLLDSGTIDGVSYISKQYTISLFPLRVGTLTLPSFTVEFGYQGDKGQEADTALPTTIQQFTVLDVPGYDPGLALITAEDLKVDDRWNPQPGKATVGDAFTRTVTMTATGLPGMALPPLKMKKIEWLAIYAQQPLVSTDTQRGAYTGKRVETYSYVCQRAGTYTLPEMKIQWWNPTGEVLQVVKLNSVTLQVAPNPLLQSSSPTAAAEGSGTPFPWPWAAAAVLMAGVAAWLVSRLRKKNKRSAPSRDKTEKAFFVRFKRAAESNDAAETMRALIQWLDAANLAGGSGGVSELVRMSGDQQLEHQLAALEGGLYSNQKKSWSGKTLYLKVAEARPKLLRHQHMHAGRRYALGPLNPE